MFGFTVIGATEVLYGYMLPSSNTFVLPWNSPGKNSGVGCHSLLQGIFPTQGQNAGLLHCRQILYRLSHKENPLVFPSSIQLKVCCLYLKEQHRCFSAFLLPFFYSIPRTSFFKKNSLHFNEVDKLFLHQLFYCTFLC